jgi:hypothetical protein
VHFGLLFCGESRSIPVHLNINKTDSEGPYHSMIATLSYVDGFGQPQSVDQQLTIQRTSGTPLTHTKDHSIIEELLRVYNVIALEYCVSSLVDKGKARRVIGKCISLSSALDIGDCQRCREHISSMKECLERVENMNEDTARQYSLSSTSMSVERANHYSEDGGSKRKTRYATTSQIANAKSYSE